MLVSEALKKKKKNWCNWKVWKYWKNATGQEKNKQVKKLNTQKVKAWGAWWLSFRLRQRLLIIFRKIYYTEPGSTAVSLCWKKCCPRALGITATYVRLLFKTKAHFITCFSFKTTGSTRKRGEKKRKKEIKRKQKNNLPRVGEAGSQNKARRRQGTPQPGTRPRKQGARLPQSEPHAGARAQTSLPASCQIQSKPEVTPRSPARPCSGVTRSRGRRSWAWAVPARRPPGRKACLRHNPAPSCAASVRAAGITEVCHRQHWAKLSIKRNKINVT